MVPYRALFLPTRLLASGNRCLVKNANWILLHFVRRTASSARVARTKKKAHRLAPPRGFALRTKFAEEFPCEHGTSFRRICELDSASLCSQNCVFCSRSAYKKESTPIGVLSFLEAPPRFGLGVEVLQTFALPLGHGAIFT